MLEKPNRKKVDKQDGSMPTNIEQLIQKYDLEKLWAYIEKIIEGVNEIDLKELIDFMTEYKNVFDVNSNNVAIGQKYDTSVNAKLQVGGGINIPTGTSNNTRNSYQIGGEPVIRNTGDATIISGKGSVYFRPNGSTDTAGQASLDTNGNFTLTGEFIKNNGYLPTYRGLTTNFNTAVTHGFYSFAGAATNITGCPLSSGNVYGTLEVIVQKSKTWVYSDNSLYIWQIYRDTYGNEYTRYGINSETMSKWRKTITYSNLYDNSSGTAGTITLLETAANFNYIEIYYALTKDSGYSCSKINAPNGKKANLQIVNGIANNNISIAGCTIAISDTSITFSAGKTIAIASGFTLNGFSNANEIKIYKVTGYK